MLRTSLSIAVAAVSLSLVACSDPAADKEAASVSSAKPVPPPPPPKSGAAATTGSAATTAAASAAPKADAAKPAKPDGALEIAAADSKVEFTGSKVTKNHDGKFEKFSGWAYIDGDKLDTARLYLEIEIASVKTDSTMLDDHLKKDDFFNAPEHPTATFQLTELKKGGADGATHTVTGNLKIRGTEKSISFPAKITLGKDDIKTTAEFKINRKDWGINYAGKANDLIRDDVVIKLDVHAKKG